MHNLNNYISIRFEDVHVRFGDVIALDGVSFEVRGPGLIQILGPNGAGKSTLLKVITGLVKPSSGRVYINGLDLAMFNKLNDRYLSYVPQTNQPPRDSPLTVWEFIETAATIKKLRWPRLFTSSVKSSVVRCLENVGLSREEWGKRLRDLSGGLFQRVLVAKALISDPAIVLLDEPLASVDPDGRVSLARLLGSIAKSKLVIVTSHDPNPLIDYTNVVILLNKRVIAMGDPLETLRLYSPRVLYPEWVSDHGH